MAEENKAPENIQAEKQAEPTAKTYSEQEYNTFAEQLRNANDTIQSYKDMDIDKIKASVEDYKTKWEQSEKERKKFEHRTKVGNFVKSIGLKDDIYEKYVTNTIFDDTHMQKFKGKWYYEIYQNGTAYRFCCYFDNSV